MRILVFLDDGGFDLRRGHGPTGTGGNAAAAGIGAARGLLVGDSPVSVGLTGNFALSGFADGVAHDGA